MKQISWKVASALINTCLFPQVLPGQRLAACAVHHARTLNITVACADATRLREVVMQSAGQSIGLMRLLPLDHARRMQLCLSLPAAAMGTVMHAVMSALPQAEFGLWHK